MSTDNSRIKAFKDKHGKKKKLYSPLSKRESKALNQLKDLRVIRDKITTEYKTIDEKISFLNQCLNKRNENIEIIESCISNMHRDSIDGFSKIIRRYIFQDLDYSKWEEPHDFYFMELLPLVEKVIEDNLFIRDSGFYESKYSQFESFELFPDIDHDAIRNVIIMLNELRDTEICLFDFFDVHNDFKSIQDYVFYSHERSFLLERFETEKRELSEELEIYVNSKNKKQDIKINEEADNLKDNNFIQWLGTEVEVITFFELLISKGFIKRPSSIYKTISNIFKNKKGNQFNPVQLRKVKSDISHAVDTDRESEMVNILDDLNK